MFEAYFWISWFKAVLVWVTAFYVVETTRVYFRVPFFFAFFSKAEKIPSDVRNRLHDKLLNCVHTQRYRHIHIKSCVKLQNNQFIYLSWYLDRDNWCATYINNSEMFTMLCRPQIRQVISYNSFLINFLAVEVGFTWYGACFWQWIHQKPTAQKD